jgi:hypothetical protein
MHALVIFLKKAIGFPATLPFSRFLPEKCDRNEYFTVKAGWLSHFER